MVASIILGLIVVVILGFAIFKLVNDKRKGKSSCGCGCSGCKIGCNKDDKK